MNNGEINKHTFANRINKIQAYRISNFIFKREKYKIITH